MSNGKLYVNLVLPDFYILASYDRHGFDFL